MHPDPECPIERALAVMGRRGALLILRDLLEATRRFGDLERSTRLPPRTLARRLRELAAAGLVTRTAHREVPPRVEYALTGLGRRIQPVMDALRGWGEELPVTDAARPGVRRGRDRRI
jgi:DNA-binding HxlR family transcriptional regulator